MPTNSPLEHLLVHSNVSICFRRYTTHLKVCQCNVNSSQLRHHTAPFMKTHRVTCEYRRNHTLDLENVPARWKNDRTRYTPNNPNIFRRWPLGQTWNKLKALRGCNSNRSTPTCAREAVARKFHLTPIRGGSACKSSEGTGGRPLPLVEAHVIAPSQCN